MKTIYKYELEVTDVQKIVLPKDAEILSVGIQNDEPVLWVKLDTDARPYVARTIIIVGTGGPIPDGLNLRFIGTFDYQSTYWFHVFVEGEL